LIRAAEKFLKKGASIIHTTSVTAYRGSAHLIDYAATKGAIVSLLRSLAAYFAHKQIRVNGIAPGPVWTPLIPTTFPPKEVATFGSETPLKRAANPVEIAYAYVFLASDEASYITGQVIHPNGGEIVNT
jgi:NAD(P)-dependent dehydrogenase (short-subunit alcohol dehydrogenase family)